MRVAGDQGRTDHQVQLVDEAVGEQVAPERAAAVHQRVAAVLLAEPGDVVVGVGASDDRGLVAQRAGVVLGDGVGDDGDRHAVGVPLRDVAVLLGRLRVLLLAGPELRHAAERRAAEQHRVRGPHPVRVVLGEREVHGHGHHVAARPLGVPVHAQHGADDDLAHDCSPLFAGDLYTGAESSHPRELIGRQAKLLRRRRDRRTPAIRVTSPSRTASTLTAPGCHSPSTSIRRQKKPGWPLTVRGSSRHGRLEDPLGEEADHHLAPVEPRRQRRHREPHVLGEQAREPVDVRGLPGGHELLDQPAYAVLAEGRELGLLRPAVGALLHRGPGALQGAVHARHRRLEQLGHLGRGELQHLAQQQHRPLGGGQVLQRGDVRELDPLAPGVRRLGVTGVVRARRPTAPGTGARSRADRGRRSG